ncbi:MAG: fused MFS/spermidine synthase, partial [Rubrivivax sp.]
IEHGRQVLDPARRREPTSYYGVTSGIGRVLRALPPERPARVGLVGLGAGTLATYGRAGDSYRIYEIDPQVFTLARSEFRFLADSAARIEEVAGDARLAMEREAPQRYDVLAIDAFSGGSVPVHLMTGEAMRVYLRHLRPDGVLAFHLTNRHLDLPPVVVEIARVQGLASMLVHDDAEGSDLRRTDWLLVARDPARLAPFARWSRPANRYTGARPWSDDFNNLLSILK